MGLRWTEANHLLATSLVQAPTEVGTHKVFSFASRLATDFEQSPALDKLSPEISPQIQLGMNGVQRCRMILPQLELGGGLIGRSGAAYEDSCRRARSDGLNKVAQVSKICRMREILRPI